MSRLGTISYYKTIVLKQETTRHDNLQLITTIKK